MNTKHKSVEDNTLLLCGQLHVCGYIKEEGYLTKITTYDKKRVLFRSNDIEQSGEKNRLLNVLLGYVKTLEPNELLGLLGQIFKESKKEEVFAKLLELLKRPKKWTLFVPDLV